MAIHCAQCGKDSPEEARFCSVCGSSLGAIGGAPSRPPFAPFQSAGRLTRPRVGRKVAGVCQGIANHFGWDVTVVRIVMLLLAILGFPIGLIVYGLVWLIAPEEALTLPQPTTYVSQS